MTIRVRIVTGRWLKNDIGWWDHVPDLLGVDNAVILAEQADFDSLEGAVKEQLGLRAIDGVEMTYQWPEWMLGPEWHQATPIYITDDEDASLFMAIRADLEELYLRVLVRPYGLDRNVNNFKTYSSIASSSGTANNLPSCVPSSVIATTLGMQGSSGNKDVASSSGSAAPQRQPNVHYGPTIPGRNNLPPYMAPTGIYRPVSNGGIIWPGIFDPSIIGDPPMQFVEYSPKERAMKTWEILSASNRAYATAGTSLGGASTMETQSMGATSSHAGKSEGQGGSGRKDGLGTESGPRNLTELWRYFHGGLGTFDPSAPQTGEGTSQVGRGVQGIQMESESRSKVGEGLDVELKLAGSYVATQESVKVPPTQTAVLDLTSSDSSSSPSQIYSSETEFSPSDMDEEDDDDDNILFVSLKGHDMTPRRVGVSLGNSGTGHDKSPAPSTGGAAVLSADKEKGKGKAPAIDRSDNAQKNKSIGVDKWKSIATTDSVPVEARTDNPRTGRLDEIDWAKTAPEIRVVPMMHSSDAPPNFDDPIGEDELDRALRDVDYEGDEIYVNRIFNSIEDCRMKLAIHAINRKFHFRYSRSSPNVVLVVCVGNDCPWRVYATQMEEGSRFEVKCCTLQHTCSVDARGNFHRQASTEVIGTMMRSRYTNEGRGPRAFELRRILRQEFSLHVSYWKAWRAREIALDNAMGSAMGSFALLPPYFHNLLQTNPNSVVGLESEVDGVGKERFKYLFFSLDACAKGFQYMRKVIVIDGTHLQGRYGGCLVAANAQDGNFQIFPLGIGIVDSENDAAWTWFLTKLSEIVPDDPELVFVSDRHASIYAGIRNVYPMASHAACIVHLQRNIQTQFKSPNLAYLVSEAARAFRSADFDRIWGEIKSLNSECAQYLSEIGFEHWTRSHFIGERYNVMSSNVSESLNNVLTMARDFPVISILETIRTTLVTWFALRRDAASTDMSLLNPKVEEMIIESFEKSSAFFVIKIGDGLYEVRDEKDVPFAVHLWERTCTCREFQLLQIPCTHAIAAAIQAGIQVDSLAGSWYTVEVRKLAYSQVIMPVPDMDSLAPSATDIGGGRLAAPAVRRPPGRPRRQRIPSRGEFKRVSKRKCTRCRGRGHNRSTCKSAMTVLPLATYSRML